MDRLKAVLVVEDNSNDTSMLQYAAGMAPSGIAFHFVGSGEEAIAYLDGVGEFANR